MSDRYVVFNTQGDEFNEALAAAVSQCQVIREDIDTFLNTMPVAAQGTFEEPWTDRQKEWDAAYDDMNLNLGAASKAGQAVHAAYRHGDRTSTYIMM